MGSSSRFLADSNRRTRFCRPLTKPLIQGTVLFSVCVCKVTTLFWIVQIFHALFLALFCGLLQLSSKGQEEQPELQDFLFFTKNMRRTTIIPNRAKIAPIIIYWTVKLIYNGTKIQQLLFVPKPKFSKSEKFLFKIWSKKACTYPV